MSAHLLLINSLMQVFSMFTSYVRLWEMQRSESLERTYDEVDSKLIENGFKLDDR